MAVNIPFIRYKIYSTFSNTIKESCLIRENVKVVCIISDKELDQKPFLKKILKAVHLDESNYEIMAVKPEDRFSIAEMGWFEKMDYFLCFGVPVEVLDIHIPCRTYHTSFFRNIRILQLPKLNKIESDKNEKQKLWLLMKKEFINE